MPNHQKATGAPPTYATPASEEHGNTNQYQLSNPELRPSYEGSDEVDPSASGERQLGRAAPRRPDDPAQHDHDDEDGSKPATRADYAEVAGSFVARLRHVARSPYLGRWIDCDDLGQEVAVIVLRKVDEGSITRGEVRLYAYWRGVMANKLMDLGHRAWTRRERLTETGDTPETVRLDDIEQRLAAAELTQAVLRALPAELATILNRVLDPAVSASLIGAAMVSRHSGSPQLSREVITFLVLIKEMSVNDAAWRLGLSRGAVYVAAHRFRRRLHQLCADLASDLE